MAQPATERHLSPRYRPDRSGTPSAASELSPKLRAFAAVLDSLCDGYSPVQTGGHEYQVYPEHEVITQLESLSPRLQQLIKMADGKDPDGRDVTISYQRTCFGEELADRYQDRHVFDISWPVNHPAEIAHIVLQPSMAVLRGQRGDFSGNTGKKEPSLMQLIEFRDRRGWVVDPTLRSGDAERDRERLRAYTMLQPLKQQPLEAQLSLFQDLVSVVRREAYV